MINNSKSNLMTVNRAIGDDAGASHKIPRMFEFYRFAID